MSATVLVPTYLAKTGYEVLQQAGLNIIEVPNVDNATLLKYQDEVAGAIMGVSPIDDQTYAQMKQLKILARIGVGFDSLNPVEAAKHGIVVTITPPLQRHFGGRVNDRRPVKPLQGSPPTNGPNACRQVAGS